MWLPLPLPGAGLVALCLPFKASPLGWSMANSGRLMQLFTQQEVPLPSSGLETFSFLPEPLSTLASLCADCNLLTGVDETGGLLGLGCPGPRR